MRAPTLLGDIVCQRFGHYAFGKIFPVQLSSALLLPVNSGLLLFVSWHICLLNMIYKNRPQPGKNKES
jgi:hypothetical protein